MKPFFSFSQELSWITLIMLLMASSLIQCKNNEVKQAPANPEPEENQVPESGQKSDIDNVEAKMIQQQDGTFGYDIYMNGALFIHQPNIPAVSGTKGFATKEDAMKVAQKAVEKMKAGQIPPTLSKEELLELGVINQ